MVKNLFHDCNCDVGWLLQIILNISTINYAKEIVDEEKRERQVQQAEH